tara:strand:+ start:285 stop:500 length:216 start_codon:yes stop_codon:yes gene_type:complete
MNKFFLLFANIAISLLWGFQGAKLFWLGIEQLGFDRYFSNEILIASQFLVIFAPPIWLTYYIWFNKRKKIY